MENEIKNKAIEDIQYIKEIIEKTSSSMVTLGNLFMKLGILFLGVCTFFIIGSRIPVPGVDGNQFANGGILQILCLILSLSMLIVPMVIFKKLIKSHPLKGVSKQIMIYWIFTISFIIICFITLIFSKSILAIFNPFHISSTDSFIPYLFSFCLFVFAFGLFVIHIFTGFKFPLMLGFIYMFSGLYFIVIQLPWNALYIFLTPITFLILGIYFKFLQLKVA
jgi:hypothetical protein